MDYIILAITVLSVLGYPIAGLIEAYRKGEKVRIIEFAKTIVIGLGTLGLISVYTKDVVLQLTSTIAFEAIIDKFIIASSRKKEDL